MSDLFHEAIDEEYVRTVFGIMERCPQHVFHLLTKRHERLWALSPSLPWPDNVWAGVTIEHMRYAERADALRQVPASVRHISAEPLLGPLDDLDLRGSRWSWRAASRDRLAARHDPRGCAACAIAASNRASRSRSRAGVEHRSATVDGCSTGGSGGSRRHSRPRRSQQPLFSTV